uniref:Endonuclease V n=1 Tax=Astyanax mexicanus TaxID=7994 RepID=A0A3B1IFD7_ASTMX
MVNLSAPYIAGFLAFREAPPLLQLLQRLEKEQPSLMPQVLFVDGNGLFHYRGELGVELILQRDTLTIILHFKMCLCALCICVCVCVCVYLSSQALRSSGSSTKPVYVSVGHRISLATAVRLTLSCCRYRVPEPIRQVNTHGSAQADRQ